MEIRIEGLCFRYKAFGVPASTDALRNIDLRIAEGEFLALVGPSGSGKTTLMQHFTGLLKPDAGRVLVDGVDIWQPRFNIAEIRQQIGLVFQFPENQLFGETVYGDVAFGPRNLGCTESEVHERVLDALRKVRLDPQAFQERLPFSLSEGEKRRVAIAGTLAMQPRCLILDEPTAGLDRGGQQAVIEVMKAFHRDSKTVVLISHNLDLVISLANRIVALDGGRIRFDGQTSSFFQDEEALKDLGLFQPRLLPVLARLRELGVLERGWPYSLEALWDELGARANGDEKLRNSL